MQTLHCHLRTHRRRPPAPTSPPRPRHNMGAGNAQRKRIPHSLCWACREEMPQVSRNKMALDTDKSCPVRPSKRQVWPATQVRSCVNGPGPNTVKLPMSKTLSASPHGPPAGCRAQSTRTWTNERARLRPLRAHQDIGRGRVQKRKAPSIEPVFMTSSQCDLCGV